MRASINSFWFGFFFYFLYSQFTQDWIGKERYLYLIDKMWSDTHWSLWLSIGILTFLGTLYYDMNKTKNKISLSEQESNIKQQVTEKINSGEIKFLFRYRENGCRSWVLYNTFLSVKEAENMFKGKMGYEVWNPTIDGFINDPNP